MGIRPKKGERVGFTGWQSRQGDPPAPPQPWMGEVIKKITYPKMTLYTVKRDHDGVRVDMYSGDLYRI